MKRILTSLLLLTVAILLHAIPAKPGQWKTITLKNGTTVRVELCGDENCKWYQAADGSKFVQAAGADYFVPTTDQALQQKMQKRRAMRAKALMNNRKKAGHVDKTIFQGTKKGLIILAQFQDTKFAAGHDVALYNRIANEENYSGNGFSGSVRDYFKAQSNNQFDLQFDVKGVVTLPKKYAYYGGNDSNGDDSMAHQMVIDALNIIKTEINLADYDWNGDKMVEEVYVLYAGKGEANGGAAATVWPHMWNISSGTGAPWSYNGYKVDVYACSSELNDASQLDGIGTFCHEFSHCMGFPDMYDTDYNGNYGMGEFDLMCSGSYNGNGRVPAGYSCYEKMETGWITPIELTSDTAVTDLKPTAQGGDAFIIYNKAHPDECYMIENRQLSGWDRYLPGSGLMIHYIDFDQTVWDYNIPNTICDYSSYATYYPHEYDFWINYKNDHQRITIFHADNKAKGNNLYPYGNNNQLTNTSTPAATTYHANTDGKKLMNVSITDITKNSDGTMSFNFAPFEPKPIIKPDHEDAIFYESFDKCAGTGGNDDQFGSGGSSTFNPDMQGWTSNNRYGALQCARFGNSVNRGIVTTPSFTIDGETSFAFMAAPWGTDGTELTLSIEAESGEATISPSTFTMTGGTWTVFNATITGQGKVKVTFTPTRRMFLDEVVAKKPATTGITTINTQGTKTNANMWFTLDGRRLNTAPTQKGIYIHDGKKVILK